MMALLGAEIDWFLHAYILILVDCLLIKIYFLTEMTAYNCEARSFTHTKERLSEELNLQLQN